ncbi:hypothetical protein M878_44585 [Streptomyces roseochromogenus subsp. oscitans DS 12.976]|uniref:Uncharacterized protein n=1 Tax=Streptomyces roseochromogenus subsp. oscitans DS 12.976 TaxID=1352936 RepID=V6JPG2_STRRC|nr:hypothetical protein M878_44585 [Streptomyces roseochromogenus subsp. oscitans DS 12.976]
MDRTGIPHIFEPELLICLLYGVADVAGVEVAADEAAVEV